MEKMNRYIQIFTVCVIVVFSFRAFAVMNPLGGHNTALLIVKFQDTPSTEGTITLSEASGLLNELGRFYSEVSYGQASVTGQAYGWFTLPLSNTRCDTLLIAGEARKAAIASGVDMSQYQHAVIVMTYNSGCGWSGVWRMIAGVGYTFVNGEGAALQKQTAAHEMGHGFGMAHSDSMSCGNEVLAVDISTCKWQGYGDSADTQGNRYAHFNSFQKERLGYLNTPSTPPITTVTASGRYHLDVYEINRMLPKALKIDRGIVNPVTGQRYSFYVEYRQPIGIDASLLNFGNLAKGLTIRNTNPYMPNYGPATWLLDMTPNSVDTTITEAHDTKDGALEVGKTYFDPHSGISITLVSADTNGAVVDVVIGSAPPPPTTTTTQAPAVDSTPPSVVITSPANAAVLSANSVVSIAANASDNVGVARVEFYVNNSLVCSDASVPYSCSWLVPKGNSKTYVIQAKALDARNNVGTHQISVSTSGGRRR